MKAHKPFLLRKIKNRKNLPDDWQVYGTSTGLKVIVSVDLNENGKGMLHISASSPDRLPTYYELKELRYKLGKDVKYMAIIFPPEEEFVNLHDNCLHMYELTPEEFNAPAKEVLAS
jgi:hypothetical protein